MKTSTSSAHPRLAALVDASAALAALPAAAGPAAVLSMLYERAGALLGIDNFVVSLYDRADELIRCGLMVVDGQYWPLEDVAPLPLGAGPTSTVLRSGAPLIVPDVLTERVRWNYRMVGSGAPVRSMLAVPMTRGGEAVGVVQAQSPRVDAFTEDDAAALSVLANQAAAALEAIRQRDHAELAAARTRLLDNAGRLLGESLDLGDVLHRLAEQVNAVVGAACAVYLLDRAGDSYESHVIRHRDPALQAPAEAFFRQRPRPPRETFVGQAILRGRPALIADLQRAPLPPTLHRSAAALGVTQALLAPIRRRGQVLGALLVLGTAAYPLRDDDLTLATALAGRAAAAIDHARLHAEATEQRRFLAHLIEAVPVGIAVVRGPDHVYEVANAVYRARLGGEHLVGRSYADVNRPTDGEPTEGGTRQLDRVLADHAPLRLVDQPWQPPGGTTRFMSLDLSPLPGDPEQGRPAGVLILLWDTTAQVLARERLEQLAQQAAAHAAELDAIFAGMAEGLIVTAADGSLRLLNDAGRAILGDLLPAGGGMPPDLLARLDVRRLDGQRLTMEEARTMWETDRPLVGLEYVVHTGNQKERVVRLSVAPLPGGGGARAGTVAIFEDVTERRALEHAREQFLAQASHELRTPLTAMLGYLQVAARRLARSAGANDPVYEAVERSTMQAQRLRELVSDLLDATRVRHALRDLRREAIDLSALVGSAMAELRHSSPRDAHTFSLEAPNEPVLGEWDPERLRQVFLNLIDNAVKYSPRGGEVRVTVRSSGPDAVVTVQDEGLGIPASEIPKLFRPFGRAEHVSRNIPGFGLGLYICRDIVEQHGGRITVASQPGRGATFTVTLPREQSAGLAPRPPLPSAGAPASSRRRRARD